MSNANGGFVSVLLTHLFQFILLRSATLERGTDIGDESVCLSQGGIDSKLMTVRSRSFHDRVARSFFDSLPSFVP